MASSPTATSRLARLAALADEWHVGPLPSPVTIVRPAQPLTFRTPNDDLAADELLKRQRLAPPADGRPRSPVLTRAFTTNRRRDKLWDPREIFMALDYHVNMGGSPGIAEALITKLISAGGDINVANARTKTNLLTRRRSVESCERSRMLQRAIDHKDSKLVAVLVPYADPLTLDAALPDAILSGRVDIVEHLLRYGASTANTIASQEAFRNICSTGGQADIVSMLLASEGRPLPETITEALVEAVDSGCLETVRHLCRAGANGSFDKASALKKAVTATRVDIALAILTGARPPSVEYVNEAFVQLFKHETILPNEKMAMTEILLCAGAAGEAVISALSQACLNNFSEMVSLLVAYGAPVDYDNAAALRRCLAEQKFNMAQILLSNNAVLQPQNASACISILCDTQMKKEERLVLVKLLLRKGANGAALNDCLIDAAKAGDVETTRLLLTPYFPATDCRPNGSGKRSPERHPVASVDYKEGVALQIAVQDANLELVKLMLATRPQPEIVAKVFPSIFHLSPEPRYQMYERFLATRFSGPCVNAALEKILLEPAATRDPRLVGLFLRHNADVNYAGGAGILAAVNNQDTSLLNAVLHNGQPAAQTVAAALPHAMAIKDLSMRRQMVQSLLAAGAGQEGRVLAEALMTALTSDPVDGELLHLLLNVGMADINFNTPSGSPVTLATAHPDPRLLIDILKTKRANQESLTQALYVLSAQPSTDAKKSKLSTLLQYANDKAALTYMLISEVEIVVKTSPRLRTFSVIKELLSAGADINAHNAAALCYAVAAPNPQIVELLLQFGPSPESLGAALSRIFFVSDAMDRLSLAKMLLNAGVPAGRVSHELQHAITNCADDIPLIKLLASFSDPEDAGGLLAAVQQQKTEIVATLIAAQKFSVSVLNQVLVEAMRTTSKGTRQAICGLLIKAGATGASVSDALVSAVQESDVSLGRVLLSNGAKADHHDGQAIVVACQTGNVSVVEMLLNGLPSVFPKEAILARAFEEASVLDNLVVREEILRLLLKHNVRGEVVDRGLIAAVTCGEDGIPLVRLLLKHNADPNYRGGEAIWTCTRNCFLPTLKLLLGLDDDAISEKEETIEAKVEVVAEAKAKEEKEEAGAEAEEGPETPATVIAPEIPEVPEATAATAAPETPETPEASEAPVNTKPHQEAMVRALKASWMLSGEDRYQVIQWLFQAGLKATEAVHLGLVKAIRDEHLNVDLVRLLVKNGASPLENGCQSLVDAAWRCLVPIVELCMTLDIPQADLDYVFAQAFSPDDDDRWLSQDGLSVARMFLEKGSRGDGPAGALIATVRDCGTDEKELALQFVQLLVEHETSVDLDRGQALQEAAKLGRQDILQLLLSRKPAMDSVAMAFPYIFESTPSENDAAQMISLFNEYRMEEDSTGLDIMFSNPECAPILFRAMLQYPRSTKILEALLDAGYYHDQMTMACVVPEMEEEQVSLLLWALLQPQKKISGAVIESLIQRGAKVNFETRDSRVTPLMLAIQNKRPGLVKTLIAASADVDVSDFAGNTPLYMAVCCGGDIGLAMMASILEADPSRNDGSLHTAARNLNIQAMKMLVQNGHEVDFPSDLHEGRSALAEVCLHGSDDRVLRAGTLKDMEHVVSYLMSQGSDITLKSEGKTPLLLALEAKDPVATTQVLLKAGMHKYVNNHFNRYDDGRLVYSPTMYVTHVLYPPTADSPSTPITPSTPLTSSTSTPSTTKSRADGTRERLLVLLRRSRTEDVYYAYNPGTNAQPPGAVGLPEDLLRAERERQARAERIAAEEEERARARRYAQELSEMAEQSHRDSLARERSLIMERAKMHAEAARLRELGEAEAQAEALRVRTKAEAEAQAEALLVRTKAETEAQAEALQALMLRREAEQLALLEQARMSNEQQLQMDHQIHEQMLSHEKELNVERVDTAKRMSTIVLDERHSIDRLNDSQNRRERARLEDGRRLADAIREIPGVAAPPAQGNRNVAGYIMGELN